MSKTICLDRLGLPIVSPDWTLIKRSCGSYDWQMIAPLARQALVEGVAPRDVDEALVSRTVAAARARGDVPLHTIASRARLGWSWLGEASPELGLKHLVKLGRATPRADQWRGLAPGFRAEFQSFLDSSGHSPATMTTEKNLLLRAKGAVDRAGIVLSSFGELFGEDARAAVVCDADSFGEIDESHQSRSKYFELGRRYAKATRDKILERDMDDLLTGDIRLPQRVSELGKDGLKRIDELKAPGRLEDLVAETEKRIRDYAAAGGEDARARAQTALMTRIALGLPCSREMLMSAAFDGPLGATDGACRPVVMLHRHGVAIAIEPRLSANTVELISLYHTRAAREAGAPRFIYEHAPGRTKSAAALSENVRSLGRDLDLALSPQTLKDFAVALLVAYAKAHPDRIDLLDIKDLMDIDQFVNFKSRYGVLCTDDLFEAVASLSGLR